MRDMTLARPPRPPGARFSILLLLVAAASCGFPRPEHIGPDDAPGAPNDAPTAPGDVSVGSDGTPDSTTCQLIAITPAIANTDDTITLEGTFHDAVTVTFPGGTSATATVLGTHRATVLVPASATEGELTVSACGASLGPQPFRRASFATGLGMFDAGFDQAEGAYQAAKLVTSRDGHTTTMVGHAIYVVGGVTGGRPLSSVERATVDADGSLGPFSTVAGVNLAAARQDHTAAVIGGYLYLLGGLGTDATVLNSVERARVNADGSLQPFAIVPDVLLAHARYRHTSVVIGNYLYVLGGLADTSLTTIERAVIRPDGSLAPFEVVPDVALSTARYGHTSTVMGTHLYVAGGARGESPLQGVEQAVISGDGSLSTFAPVPGAALNVARSGHTTMIVGSYLYVLGGIGATALASIERAPLDTSGTLGAFAVVPGLTLTTARHGHTMAVVGNYLYVLGGTGGLTGIERSSLNASGSLGAFATLPDVTLTTARSNAMSAVIGDYLYVLGGANSVERASIHADGTLDSFAPVLGITIDDAVLGPIANTGSYLYALGRAIGRAPIHADSTLDPFTRIADVVVPDGRVSFTATMVGRYLYVVGGYNVPSQTPVRLSSIARAPLAADGSLGPFEPVSPTLTAARSAHAAVLIANYLYVLGGDSETGPLKSVERAVVNSDGSVGSFAVVPELALTVPRAGHTAEIVGNQLYIVGGKTDLGSQNSIERAAIAPDGSVGPFAPVANVTLDAARRYHATRVIGNYLYLVGGFLNNTSSARVERANLGAN